MADELDPKRQNEELGRTAEEDARSVASDQEEFEDIDESDADEDDDAIDVEE